MRRQWSKAADCRAPPVRGVAGTALWPALGGESKDNLAAPEERAGECWPMGLVCRWPRRPVVRCEPGGGARKVLRAYTQQVAGDCGHRRHHSALAPFRSPALGEGKLAAGALGRMFKTNAER